MGDEYEKVGRMLRRAREQRELTRADVASAIGVDQQTIYRAEHGRASLETLLRIAHVVGVSNRDVLKGVGL